MHEGILSERMSQIDTSRCLFDGRLKISRLLQLSGRKNSGPAPATAPTAEQLKADVALLVAHSTAMLNAFDQTSNWPGYKSRDPAQPVELSNNPGAHPLAGVLFSPMNRAFESHYRMATERRLAAVGLAVRAYAAAHDGKLPGTLDALVPDYLPSVPDDPMADAMPLQYQSDPARPIVYSVGTNGTDDGGSDASAQGRAGGGGFWQGDDSVMHLSRPVAAPAAAPAKP
jgi:hypothetical protein